MQRDEGRGLPHLDLPRRTHVRCVQLDLLAVLGRDRELAAVRVVEEAQWLAIMA